MATLALGYLYLSLALFSVLLLKTNFNVLDFAYNPANKKFFYIIDLISIPLCILSISEQVHWLLMVLVLVHVCNSGYLYSNKFYDSENEVRELGEDVAVYLSSGMTLVAGIFCIYIAYL